MKQLNPKSPLRPTGFTLVELLVAMVITGIMLTLVMGSYWTFLQTQQKMTVSREIQSEVRFALSRITDKVRSSRINYLQYTGSGDCAVNMNHNLCLISAGTTPHLLAYDDVNKTLSMGSDTSDLQPLISSQKFAVESLHFDFSPKDDPSLLSNPQMQPKVTVFIKVTPRNVIYADLAIENQTTISSRQY